MEARRRRLARNARNPWSYSLACVGMRVLRWLCAGAVASALWAGAAAAAAPATAPPTTPDTTPSTVPPVGPSVSTPVGEEGSELGPEVSVPFQVPPLITETQVVSGPLVPVPPDCAAPQPAIVVFIGTLVAADSSTARFQIEQVRAGSVVGHSFGQLIDIRYGSDTRFLDVSERYIIGAGVDPALGVLVSKVREPAPLFGGDSVIGLNDSDVLCPRVEDPMRTLRADGTLVDSGLFTPLKRAKSSVLSALLRPLVIGFILLLGLVAFKHLLFAVGRSLREMGEDRRQPVRRERRHRDPVAPPSSTA